MAMTYAALAKSLGITLKSSSSSASASSASSGPGWASQLQAHPTTTTTPASTSVSKTADPGVSGKQRETETKPETESGKEEDQRIASTPVPTTTSANGKVAKTKVSMSTSTPSNIVADADSDIASSRSSSPVIAPILPSSPVVSSVAEAPEGKSELQRTSSSSTTATMVEPASAEPGNAGSCADADETARTQQATDKDLTDEQLHHAKVLVLDLLGWGVPPEYLLQRGISHALLYTVFTDLRLRLPEGIVADCIALVATQHQTRPQLTPMST